jgi:cytochrome c biogenesis protein CcmG/thiol:disulfide interchange protein DsbE
MKMRSRFLPLVTILGVAFLFVPIRDGASSSPSVPTDFPFCEAFGVQRFEVRKEAPPFSLRDLDGEPTSLSDFKGKPVLMMFWALWCPSCREEIPVFNKYFSKRQDQVAILLLAIDGEREKRIRRYVQKEKITLPVLLDVKEKVARAFGVNFIPVVLLIDREGWVIGKIVGERDWSSPKAWSAIKEVFCLR